MRKIKTYFIFAIIMYFVFVGIDYSEDTYNFGTHTEIDSSVFSMMPLQVGNTWVYHTYWNSEPGYVRMEITDSSYLNNHIYYLVEFEAFGVINQWCCCGPLAIGYSPVYLRIDSTSGNLLMYSPDSTCYGFQGELLIDSLAASNNDSIFHSRCIHNMKSTVNQIMLFGETRTNKSFGWVEPIPVQPYFYHRAYASNIGLRSNYQGRYIATCRYDLIGCVVNGVYYGDTVTTNLITLSSHVPEQFSLHQNYPNPFNPNTRIKFKVKSLKDVKLSVYDISGKEIAVLVNEKLSAGEYEYQFEGNNLTSGVYFYRLQAGEYVETRKMVLMK